MSGGEKARLALALIVWQKPNLLLLDEPSNHLDVETREALTTALAEFGGSMLLVSHDRHLLRTTVDSFWIVADGSVLPFDGDLEDYRDWLSERQQAARRREDTTQTVACASPAPAGANLGPVPDRKQQKRDEAQARQRIAALRKPLQARLDKVEDELARVQQDLRALDELIADPELYTEARRNERVATLARHGELSKRCAELEETWLGLHSELDQLEIA